MTPLIANKLVSLLEPFSITAGCGLDPPSLEPSAQPLVQGQHAPLIDALFHPNDLVELRAIESWQEQGKRQSKLHWRAWLTPHELNMNSAKLHALNEAADIFFGVNARLRRGSTKEAIGKCRSVWADFDGVASAEVLRTCSAINLAPSIVVESGHGVHAYWLLEEPFDVHTSEERNRFESMLRRFYRSVGADSTCDVTRLLRLPGFRNNKNLRNGAAAQECSLLLCEPAVRYPTACFFERWRAEEEAQKGAVHPPRSARTDKRLERRIEGFVRYLDKEVSDRSKRDFAVVAGLLRLGLDPQEIRTLVASHSKFAGPHGERYFKTTVSNALKAVGTESSFD